MGLWNLPSVSRGPAAPLSLQIHFLKQGCGEDKVCQSNLQLRHARFCARISDTECRPLPL